MADRLIKVGRNAQAPAVDTQYLLEVPVGRDHLNPLCRLRGKGIQNALPELPEVGVLDPPDLKLAIGPAEATP